MPLLSPSNLLSSTNLLGELTVEQEAGSPPSLLFLLSDLAGNTLSDLPGALGKQASLTINGTSTASVQVRLDHDDVESLLTGDTLLRIYLVDTVPRLVFHGRQVTFEERVTDQAASLACTFADPSWFLARRLVGKSAAGYSRGTALAPVNRSTIVQELLVALNSESTTRLAVGSMPASGLTYVAGWTYKPMSEALQELTQGADAPEWQVRPREYDAGYVGALDVKPVLGTMRPDTIFEVGDGGLNAHDHARIGTLEGSANRVFSLPASGSDTGTDPVIAQENSASLAQRELLETTLATDLTVPALRSQLALDRATVTGGLRETLSFNVIRDLGNGTVPRYGTDYDLGDLVPYRVSTRTLDEDSGEMVLNRRLDAVVRVYGVDLATDDEGAMTIGLTTTRASV
jgi:hypothetical protein